MPGRLRSTPATLHATVHRWDFRHRLEVTDDGWGAAGGVAHRRLTIADGDAQCPVQSLQAVLGKQLWVGSLGTPCLEAMLQQSVTDLVMVDEAAVDESMA